MEMVDNLNELQMNRVRRLTEWIRGNISRIQNNMDLRGDLSISKFLKSLGIRTKSTVLFSKFLVCFDAIKDKHKENNQKINEDNRNRDVYLLNDDVEKLKTGIMRYNQKDSMCLDIDDVVRIMPHPIAYRTHRNVTKVTSNIVNQIIGFRRYSCTSEYFFSSTSLLGGGKMWFACKKCNWITDYSGMLEVISYDQCLLLKELHMCSHCIPSKRCCSYPYNTLKFMTRAIFEVYIRINREFFEQCRKCKGKIASPIKSPQFNDNRSRRLLSQAREQIFCADCVVLPYKLDIETNVSEIIERYIYTFAHRETLPISLYLMLPYDVSASSSLLKQIVGFFLFIPHSCDPTFNILDTVSLSITVCDTSIVIYDKLGDKNYKCFSVISFLFLMFHLKIDVCNDHSYEYKVFLHSGLVLKDYKKNDKYYSTSVQRNDSFIIRCCSLLGESLSFEEEEELILSHRAVLYNCTVQGMIESYESFGDFLIESESYISAIINVGVCPVVFIQEEYMKDYPSNAVLSSVLL